jgi:hypothetical protein
MREVEFLLRPTPDIASRWIFKLQFKVIRWALTSHAKPDQKGVWHLKLDQASRHDKTTAAMKIEV